MELINGAGRLPAHARPLYLALGNFDGVHLGHQSIIRSAVNSANRENGLSAVMVFDPHPLIALQSDNPPALLTDIVDRAEIMAELGLDYMIIQPFDDKIASLSPEQFVRQILKDKLDAREVFIGPDYSFGRKGAGSSDTLCHWGRELGFSVKISPMVKHKGVEVSSSMIRSLLLAGKVNEAADLLGYYFFRQGKVISGHGIGKKLVYPTANISANPRLIWPGKGVYFTAVGKLNGGLLYGVSNVGSRPTFSHFDITVETHIIDFQDIIYNREIRLCFLEKLRETRTFTSAARLKEQIGRDIEQGRYLIGKYMQETNGSGKSLQAGCSVLRSQ